MRQFAAKAKGYFEQNMSATMHMIPGKEITFFY